MVLYLIEVFILAHYGPPSTETPTTTIVWCHKNSSIYLRCTYYWWLLRPTITIRFNSKWKNTIRTALVSYNETTTKTENNNDIRNLPHGLCSIQASRASTLCIGTLVCLIHRVECCKLGPAKCWRSTSKQVTGIRTIRLQPASSCRSGTVRYVSTRSASQTMMSYSWAAKL